MKSAPRSESARDKVAASDGEKLRGEEGIQSFPGIRTRRGMDSGMAARVRAVSSRRRRMRFSKEPE